MSSQSSIPVVAHDGLMGVAEPLEQGGYRVRFDDGTELEVDADSLIWRPDNTLFLPKRPEAFRPPGEASPRDRGEGGVVPLAEEQLHVGRQRRETGKVVVRKVVYEQEHTIDQPVLEEVVEVERVPIDQLVNAPPPTRQEGDTIVMPLVEEVFVVEKRLRVREEVRITRHRREVSKPQRVTTRREDVEVEREPSAAEQHGPARDLR